MRLALGRRMQTTSDLLHENTAKTFEGSKKKLAPRARTQPRTRTGLAVALTAFAVALGAALTLAFGYQAIPLYLIGFPVPLWLLWLSTDVWRADEQ